MTTPAATASVLSTLPLPTTLAAVAMLAVWIGAVVVVGWQQAGRSPSRDASAPVWLHARRGLARAAVRSGIARPASGSVPPAWQQARDDLRRAAAAVPAMLTFPIRITASTLRGTMRAFARILAGVREVLRPVPRAAGRWERHRPTGPQGRHQPIGATARLLRRPVGVTTASATAAGATAGGPSVGDRGHRRAPGPWPSWARIRAGLAPAAGAVDRAIAAALVGLARLVARLAVGLARLLATAVIGAGRATGHAVALAATAATRLTAATTVLAIVVLLAAALVPLAASGIPAALHVSTPAAAEQLTLARLAERSRVVSSDGVVLGRLHGEINRRVVSLEEVPETVRHAVVAAEDQRFYEHDGFDVHGIVRAAWTNLEAGRIEAGGSTITQQVAKANFTDGARTLDRKLTELRYSRALEAELTKDEILERYLNEVYFGRGAYGVAAGAEAFFGRPVAYLEAHQAALLAGMIAAPGYFNPDTNPERARTRRNQVLAGMAEQGFLSRDRAELAASRPLDVVQRTRTEHLDPYVIEQVKRELLASPALGATLGERVDALFEGGLTVHTSVDWRLQQRADELIAEHVGDIGPTAAMVVMDDHTGEIVVTRSGRDFDEDQFDPALQGRRQPGSAFKAFVLATALEQGWSLDDPINANSPAVLEFGGLRPWHVTNYAGRSLGTLTLADALRRSSNTAFARLILQVGQDEVEDMLQRLGIDVDRALGQQRGLSPAIALGGVRNGMTLPEMATAFGALATDGRRSPAHLVTKVTGPDGDVLLRRQPERPRAVSQEIASQMRQALLGVVESGTGRRAQIPGREVVGKTGTSQQWADAWFVGQTSGLVGAVWIGHPEGRISMGRMTGGSVPATLWREIMQTSLARPVVPPG